MPFDIYLFFFFSPIFYWHRHLSTCSLSSRFRRRQSFMCRTFLFSLCQWLYADSISEGRHFRIHHCQLRNVRFLFIVIHIFFFSLLTFAVFFIYCPQIRWIGRINSNFARNNIIKSVLTMKMDGVRVDACEKWPIFCRRFLLSFSAAFRLLVSRSEIVFSEPKGRKMLEFHII